MVKSVKINYQVLPGVIDSLLHNAVNIRPINALQAIFF